MDKINGLLLPKIQLEDEILNTDVLFKIQRKNISRIPQISIKQLKRRIVKQRNFTKMSIVLISLSLKL